MYSIAKLKYNDLSYLLYGKNNSISLRENYYFYNHIVLHVENWIKLLEKDEVELISLRYFQNFSLEDIAIKLGYANHSSVIYKLNIIIKKIERSDI